MQVGEIKVRRTKEMDVGISDVPDFKLTYRASTIRPDRIFVVYKTDQDAGEWEVDTVRISGPRILKNGFGRYPMGEKLFNYARQEWPEWVIAFVDTHMPAGDS